MARNPITSLAFQVALINLVTVVFLTLVPLAQASDCPLELPPFSGQAGEKVIALNGEIQVDTARFHEEAVVFFHTELTDGKTVYFFVVKAPDGHFRAAANGCLFCYPTQLGFTYDNGMMRCVTCGYTFPLDTIAIKDGDCHPIPINRSLEIRGSTVIISLESLAPIGEFF